MRKLACGMLVAALFAAVLLWQQQRAAQQARAIHEQLMLKGCICDWREPDVIRVAPVPLYNSFADIWHFVETLRELCAAPR